MTSDLQQLIKFPVGASFPSFETVQCSSPAMHMSQQNGTLASNRLLRSLCLSLSKCEPNGRNDASAEDFQGIMFRLAFSFSLFFFAAPFQTKVLKSNYF